jgi:hypothetical protein
MSGWGGIIFLLLFLIGVALSALMVVAPFAVPTLVFYLLRRYGVGFKAAIFYGVAPVLLLLVWPLSGLFDLSEKCGQTSLVRSSSEKLGPVDALLIDGPGMWWLDGKIDVERPKYGEANQFWRREAKQENKKRAPQSLSEAELRSRYKVTIERPQGGDFLQRYLTTASIKIEDRATGAMVASVQEPAWGGGLAGGYIGALSALNPFLSDNRYLSCGYATQGFGIFRSPSKERSQLYMSADQELIEQVLILSTTK